MKFSILENIENNNSVESGSIEDKLLNIIQPLMTYKDADSISGPSYILSNGKCVDIEDFYNKYGTTDVKYCNFPYHFVMQDYAGTQLGYDYGRDDDLFRSKLNAVRINDGNWEDAWYIDLPDKPLTSSQYYAIQDWLDKVLYHAPSEGYVIIGTSDDYNEYYLSDYLPEDLVKIIKRYYSSGTLYESVNLDDIPDENKGGDCFVKALHYVQSHPNATLCHGIVTGQGPLHGLQYNHAWAEENGNVIDKTVNLVCPKEIYYLIGKIKIVYKYNSEEMRKKMISEGTYGPWEEELWQYP